MGISSSTPNVEEKCKSERNKDSKQIVWIDQNVNNAENKFTLEYLKTELKNDYNIITLESVKEAFQLFEIRKTIFEFNLFYVIVSGRLAEEFFNKYAEKVIDMNILCAPIIYCFNDSFHKKKNYYKDSFLNPGGIVSSPDKIVKYIKKVEIENNPIDIQIGQNPINSNSKGYGYTFSIAKNLSQITLPLIISHFIKSYLISKKSLEEMKKNFLSIFGKDKRIIDYIYPQKEKKIDIPYHILAKFYARLYTLESDFYYRINKDLTNKKFDFYRNYIFLLYNGLHKKTLKNYSSSELYRGGVLSKQEYQRMNKYMEKREKNSIVLYYLNNFASFSKDEETANEFLVRNQLINYDNKELIYVKYILDKNKDENFFVPNIDLETISKIIDKPEKEVCFLPLSCFEIYSIEEEKENNYSIIRLRYLTKYKKDLLEQIEKMNTKEEIESFFSEIVESKYAKDIAEIIGVQAQDKINTFIKKGDKNEIKQAILSISSSFFTASFCAGGALVAGEMMSSFFPSLAPYSAFIPSFSPLSAVIAGIAVIGCVGIAGYNYYSSSKVLELKSYSLYSKYIPEKYRNEKIFPSFTWENVSFKTKSFIIELIEDDINKKWQVINISKDINKIIENTNINGETIIEYKGISDNASCALFILYEISKEKITLEELNNPEKMKDLVINMAFLEVY